MQVPLFLDPTIKLEKVAAACKLEGDPDRWPIEILKVAYKSVPSLKSYEADVELDRVDSARGYAVGKMLVYPNGMTKEAASGRDKLVSLPLIVRDHELAPMDVFSYKGSMYPMDEHDMQEIMTRTETFSRIADRDQFVGTNLFGQLIPPNTDHQYNAGSLMKHGSANLWKIALENASPRDVDSFKSVLKDDHALRHAYATNAGLRSYVEDAMGYQEKTASQKRADRLSTLKPSVVQLSFADGEYQIKTANHRCWSPQTEKLTRYEAQTYLGDKFNDLLSQGHLTFVSDPIAESVYEKVASVADRVGVYEVWSGPNQMSGIVIPSVRDLDGRATDLQIFASSAGHAVQEKVAGVLRNELTLPDPEPRGLGVFVDQSGVALEPVYVLNKVAHANEVGGKVSHYFCKRASTGQEVRLLKVAGLYDVVNLGNSEYAIPDTAKFVALPGSQIRISPPDVAQTFEHQKVASTSVTLRANDGTYWVNAGPFSGNEYNAQEMEFVLGGLGLSGKQARETIKTASAKGKVTIGKTREVLDETARGSEFLKTASASVQKFSRVMPKVEPTYKVAAVLTSPKAQELWKQASISLPKESVDAILSLNFVTPENASAYLNYLPILEKTSSILAELVVASRLGMDDVRETAAINAMTQVNAVVKGLEKLSEKVR